MSIKHNVSVLALLTALAASPVAAQVDLSIGGDDGVGVDLDTSDGIDAEVGVGGDDGLNVDAGVGASDGQTNVEADVDLGAGGEGDGSILDTDVNLGVGGDDSLVNLDADAGILEGDDGDPLVDADANVTLGGGSPGGLLSLDEGSRSAALLSLIGNSGIEGVDLDAVVDDTRIVVVDVNDLMSEDDLADIEVALLDGENSGMEETQAAVEASATLSSILADEGLSASDVLAVEVEPDGGATVYVLRGGIRALQATADADIGGEGLLDAEAGALTGDEAASADVSILPGAGGDGAEAGSETGAEVNLDASLGETDAAGIEANILSNDELASAQLVILPDDDGTGGDGGADGGAGVEDDDGGAGPDTGDTGTGSGDDDGTAGGSDASDSPADSAGGDAGTGAAAEPDVDLTADAQAGTAVDGTMPCPADLRAFLEDTATASDIRAANDAQVVQLSGCSDTGVVGAADFSRLRDVIETDPVTSAAVEAAADVSFDDVISASVSGGTVILYAIAEE